MEVILIALLSFAVLAGLGVAATSGGPSKRTIARIQAVSSASAKGGKPREKSGRVEDRRKQIETQLKATEKHNEGPIRQLEGKLHMAGLSLKVNQLLIGCAGLGAVIAVVLFAVSSNPLIALAGGCGMGFGLPIWVIGFIGDSRMKKFAAEFPNAVDLLVRGVKSGLPVPECLSVIARESGAPLGPEFGRLVENLRVGLTLDQALEKLYLRVPISEVRFFSIVLAIQQKSGGNLGEALGNLSAVLRARKLMREKIKAFASEATTTAMIIGCLPPGLGAFLSFANPDFIAPLWQTKTGIFCLMGGLGWMGTGVFVMKRMINFKI